MKNNKTFQKTVLAAAIALSSAQVAAAGFQLNAQSATGLGRAFSGDAVIADNASVMARNAAAMALFDKTELSLGFTTITTDITVSDSTYTTPTGYSNDSDYDDAGGTSIAPNIHLIVPLNEQFAVGINLYSNFGTKTEFSDSFTASEYGGLTDVKSINLGLAASYRINQQWSVGGGLDIIYGAGELKRTANSNAPLVGGATLLDADAAGVGFGFNLGTVFELNENNRFGLSYHYSPELEAEGDIMYLPSALKGQNPQATDDTLYMPLPDMAEFSGYHRLTDSKFAVHYSVQWIGWGAFDTLESKAHGTLNEYQWKDAMHFSLGGTYYLNNKWTLRGGYMYDQSAQDEVTSISVPDSDRQWFSAGFSYHFSDDSTVDLGATYLVGQDVEVTESQPFSTVKGTTHADAILMAVQYSHSF